MNLQLPMEEYYNTDKQSGRKPYKLGKYNTLTLCWITENTSIPVNDKADTLAETECIMIEAERFRKYLRSEKTKIWNELRLSKSLIRLFQRQED